MSKPSIIMLVHSSTDDGIDRLNARLANSRELQGTLTRVDRDAPQWDPATAVHIGSFNHLDEPYFMALVRDAGWRETDRVQLFIDREDDLCMTEYDPFNKIAPHRIRSAAHGRGMALASPQEQRAFFAALIAGQCAPSSERLFEGWAFEVVAIHPAYRFEAGRLSPGGHTIAPVDLAYEGFGVQWLCRETDQSGIASTPARQIVETLNPRDTIVIGANISALPSGIAEIREVRSIRKRT